ncbi:MAG: hypothetical protein ABIH71_03180 [Candidatus Omnitrophota bacterium]|nr:hypothetical protein [Candidatus Omnitrophota bacterium]
MRKSFTLMEIMMASVIVVILATLGMGGYIFLLENAKQKACVVNQETWLRVAEIKVRETGILGKFDLEKDMEYIGRAYAEKIKEADWYTKFAYSFVKINKPKQAYAAVTTLMSESVMKKYGVDPQILKCPSSGLPYGVNTALQDNMRWKDIPVGTILIGDCDSATFTNLEDLNPSHFVNPFTSEGEAIAITVEGKVLGAVKKPNQGIKKTKVIMAGNNQKFDNNIYEDGTGRGNPKLTENIVNKCLTCENKRSEQARSSCIKTHCPLYIEPNQNHY